MPDLDKISLVCVCDGHLAERADDLATKMEALPFGEKVLYVNNVDKYDFSQVGKMSILVYGSLLGQELPSILKTSLSITRNPYLLVIREEELGAIQMDRVQFQTEITQIHSTKDNTEAQEEVGGASFEVGMNTIYERKTLTRALYVGE